VSGDYLAANEPVEKRFTQKRPISGLNSVNYLCVHKSTKDILHNHLLSAAQALFSRDRPAFVDLSGYIAIPHQLFYVMH